MNVHNPYDGDEPAVKVTAGLLAGVGALNWGLSEAVDLNIVTELLGSGSAGIAYLAIGAGGALYLADTLGLDVLGGDA